MVFLQGRYNTLKFQANLVETKYLYYLVDNF